MLGDDYPLLFPVGDSVSLASRLIDALTRDEVRELARARVIERAMPFHVRPVIDRLEALMTSEVAGS